MAKELVQKRMIAFQIDRIRWSKKQYERRQPIPTLSVFYACGRKEDLVMKEGTTWEDVLGFLSSHGIEADPSILDFLDLVKDIEAKVTLHKNRLMELEKGTEEYDGAEAKYNIMVTIFNQANRIKELPYRERVQQAERWIVKMREIAAVDNKKLTEETA